LEDTTELEPRLAVNDLLRVSMPDDQDSGNYYSRIEDITEKMLLVTWPTDNGAPLQVHPDQMLSFSIVRDGNAYSFNGMVDKVGREPLPVVSIIVTSSIERIQRRQDFRVKCLIPIEVVATLPETLSGLHPASLHLKTHTYDLSASGISMRIATAVPTGTLPVIKFSLPDGRPPIKASCRVIHCFVPTENPNKFHVGMQYLKLDENDRARIVRHIYRTQLKRIRF
jgi:c-di-GMP-binding flagellar brake protein YcgR